MLFVDGQKLSQQEFADLWGLDLAKIRKRPSFELDKSKIFIDKANGNAVKVNKGTAVRARFFAMHPKKQIQVPVIYAQTENPKEVGGTLRMEYLPRYVQYSGEKFEFKSDIDLALWMALHPQNKFSPLRSKDSKTKSSYEFIDVNKRTVEKMSNLSALQRALDHAGNSNIDELIITAKGLGFRDVDKMEEDELRASVMEFAANPRTTRAYINAMDSSLVKVEGRITNLVDKGVIRLDKVGNVRQWFWRAGERDGEPIGPQILNNSQDARKSLRSFILNNLDVYESSLIDYTTELRAREAATKHLEKKQEESKAPLPDHLKDASVSFSGDDLRDEVSNFQEAKAFVEKMGYKKIPGNVKKLEEAVISGDVTRENVSAYLRELYAQD